MRITILLLIFIFTGLLSFSQIPKSGIYTFRYCDLEYNKCLGSCKVVIKGNHIVLYATKELAENRTFTKEGDIVDQGIILKHKSGKWIIGKTRKDVNAKQIGVDGPPILDFKKKQYWTF
jgi:hypothetical protein